MRPENFDIKELINDLVGTSKDIEEVLPEGMRYEDLGTKDLYELDEKLFLCDECGWWCENSNMGEGDSTEQICHDCING